MLVNVLRKQAGTALLASRLRLPAAHVHVCRARLTLPALPGVQHIPRTYSTAVNNRSVDPKQDEHATSTVFVGNLPWSVDEREIADMFSIFGNILDIRVGRTAEGKSRGFAHIDFESREDARKAVEVCEYEPFYVQDRDLTVDFGPQRYKTNSVPHYKLYVGDFDGNEEDLRKVFQEYSNYIVRASILKDQATGESMRSCIVDFINVARAAEARNALRETVLPNGKKLRIDFARKRAKGDRVKQLAETRLRSRSGPQRAQPESG